MGCDIHLFAETRWRGRAWVSQNLWATSEDDGKMRLEKPESKYRFYSHGRNYNLFAALAGVRSFHFSENVPPISKPKGIPKDLSIPVEQYYNGMKSDAHSMSWLTIEEIEAYDFSPWGNTCDAFILEVLPKMKALRVQDTEVRIVFWFDN